MQDYFLPPCPAFVSLISGKLIYVIMDHGKYKTIHEETYEEALRIVQKENEINN